MKARIFITSMVATVLALVCVGPVWSQYPRYRPPGGSPLPNALNYFRQDVGVLDPYNAFIAPRREIDNRFRELAFRQQTEYQATRQAIGMIRASEAAPTGTGATFMNYSHYYRMQNAPRTAGR
jgi:hypothetical protein